MGKGPLFGSAADYQLMFGKERKREKKKRNFKHRERSSQAIEPRKKRRIFFPRVGGRGKADLEQLVLPPRGKGGKPEGFFVTQPPQIALWFGRKKGESPNLFGCRGGSNSTGRKREEGGGTGQAQPYSAY